MALPIYVLGAGSIGVLTAWHLRHAQVPVTLLLRRAASAEHVRSRANRIALEYSGAHITGRPAWLRNHPEAPAWDVNVELAQEDGSWASSSSGGSPGPQPCGEISRLIVATKAADAVPALLSVLRRLSPTCEVLLLQNGILGVYQEVQSKVLSSPGAPPSLSLLVGSVTHGAYLRSPSHVVHSGMGSIKLAPVDARLPTLTHPDHQKAWDRLRPGSYPTGTGEEEREGGGEASPPRKQHHQHPHHHREKGDNAVEAADGSGGGDASRSGQAEGAAAAAAVGWDGMGGDGGGLLRQLLAIPSLAAELVPSHASLMRQIHLKLAVNCAVNPGTALLGCLNDAYTEDAWGRQVMHSVCAELHGLYGSELLGMASGEELAAFVLQVASGTGKNKNSMLQDVQAGRPTEISYLNGYVARWAEEQGRSAPVNALLQTLIKAKESLGRSVD